MTTRTKTILKAPAGVDESVINGSTYWPDEDGLIETTNVEHIPVLKLHGYTVVQEIAVSRPGGVMAPIEHEELGKQGLVEALEARGLNYPPQASRADLADIAEGWNRARQRRGPAAELKKVEVETLASGPGGALAAPDPDKPDFSASGIKELKGWLVARGVAVPPGMPAIEVRKLAEDTYVALKEKAAA